MSTKIKSIIGIVVGVVLTTLLVIGIFQFASQFSSFAIALVLVDIAILKLWFVDKFILHSYDTLEELKNGNVAVGLALVAYALVISAAVISAFVVWH